MHVRTLFIPYPFTFLGTLYFVPRALFEQQVEQLLQQPTKTGACLQAGPFFAAPSWRLKPVLTC